MAIASRLKWFLDVNRARYDVLPACAEKSDVCSDDQFVESRLFHDAHGYVMVVHPCLLYTSPSPRDRQKSRMPSSA